MSIVEKAQAALAPQIAARALRIERAKAKLEQYFTKAVKYAEDNLERIIVKAASKGKKEVPLVWIGYHFIYLHHNNINKDQIKSPILKEFRERLRDKRLKVKILLVNPPYSHPTYFDMYLGVEIPTKNK